MSGNTMITNLIVAFLRWIGLMKNEAREHDDWELGNDPSEQDIDRAHRLAVAFQTLDMTIMNITTKGMNISDIFALVIDLWVQDQDKMLADGLLLQMTHMEEDEYHNTWHDACSDVGLDCEDGYMTVADPRDGVGRKLWVQL
tara:strand:+ start:698 stop:1123 length:426 start_codon:yes stop_codon:yes gene_type:complete